MVLFFRSTSCVARHALCQQPVRWYPVRQHPVRQHSAHQHSAHQHPAHWLSAIGAGLVCAGLALPSLAAGTGAQPRMSVASVASAPGEPVRTAQLVREGQRYENAEGVERDPARALALYCEAARLDDADGFLRMGWMYANARGVERDDGLAGNLLQRAAALGNPTAARLTTLIRPDAAAPDRIPDCLRPPPAASAATSPARTIRFDFDFDDPARARVLRPLMTPALRARLQAPLVELAREYQLDPGLVLAVMRAESGFNPLALSPKNAQGLMQLIPETAERFAVRNAFDPVENLRGGMRYLRWLLSYFEGDVRLALAGYNAGEGAVDRARGVPPWPETRQYIQRIRTWYPHEFHPFEPRVTKPAPWLRRPADPAAAEKRSALR